MKTISVIIPTYNRAWVLLRAISSVLYQSFSDYELIIVDDGSTDNTTELLNSYFKDIHIISIPQNMGVSHARNVGIEASSSTFISFLDSDDYWFAQKLETQIRFFERNPDALICQTDELWIRDGRRVNPRKKHRKPSGDIFEKSLSLCVVSPSAVMLKREIFDEVGMFDENLPACEDYDLWLRIASRYPVYLIDRPLVVKTGGHRDQLSRSIAGLDKYRIYSIMKIINSGLLNEKQLKQAIDELKRKCAIYGNGCLKRGRIEEGNYYLNLPARILYRLKQDLVIHKREGLNPGI